MQLPEAVTIGPFAARHIDRDSYDEPDQKHRRAQRAPPNRFQWQQQASDRNFEKWEAGTERSRQPVWESEIKHRRARAIHVEKLGNTGHAEYHRKRDSGKQQDNAHNNSSNVPYQTETNN